MEHEGRYLSTEILEHIVAYCDMRSILLLARANSRLLHVASREYLLRLNGKQKTTWSLADDPVALFHELAQEEAKDGRFRPVLFKRLEIRVTQWAVIGKYSQPAQDRLVHHKFISSTSISNDLFGTADKFVSKSDQEETVAALRKVAPPLLYKIWQRAFLSAPTEEKQVIARRKLLSFLTFEILTIFRDELIIDDRFALKCFENKLDSVLLYIIANPSFFTFNITTPRLQDLYIMIACEIPSTGILLRFLSEMERPHLEYALRHANFDTLMLLWKSKRYIRSFDQIIQEIRNDPDVPMPRRDPKQRQFLDWCASH